MSIDLFQCSLSRRDLLLSAIGGAAAVTLGQHLGFAQEGGGKKYALLVGVQKYDPAILKPLDYAENDMMALAKTLEVLGFDVILMTSQQDIPTRVPMVPQDILKQLERLLTNRQSQDMVIVAMSGHGVQLKADALMEDGGKETYFCPQRADPHDRESLLPLSNVIRQMEASSAGRKLLLVDACRSEIEPTEAKNRAVEIELAPVGPIRRREPQGMAALFSCSGGERSFELKELGHGAFVYQLLRYLDGEAGASEYPQGEVSLTGLASFVSRETRDYVAKNLDKDQTPELIGRLNDWSLGRVVSQVNPLIAKQIEILRRKVFRGSNRKSESAKQIIAEIERQGFSDPEFVFLKLLVEETDTEKEKLFDQIKEKAPRSYYSLAAEVEMSLESIEGKKTMSVEKYMRQTEILDRLIILRPDYEYTISVAQRILGWSSFANSLTFDRLNNFLKEALERNPNDPLIHEAIGNQFQIDPKTHDLALKYLSNAIEIDPAYAVAYNVRGHCKILMDKYDEAIADFDKSLVLEPSFVNAAMQKIRCVRNLNRTAESKALLDQLIKQADLTSFDCIYAAGFYTEIGDKNASEKMIEKALQLEPANAFAYEKMLSIAVSENQLNFRDSIKRIVGKYKGKVAFHEEVSLDIVANLITGGLRHANKLCNQVDRGLSGTAKKLAISMASLLGDRKVVIRRINDLAETRVCIERYISNLNQAFRERNVTVLVPSNVTGSVHVLTSGGIVAVGPGEKVSIPCGGLFQGNTLFEDNPEFTHSVCYYTGKRTVLDQELWMVERIDSSREVLEFTTFKNEGESVWVPAGR